MASSSAGPSDSALHLPLGAADQSCKECRRRKAKCDRAMPTCGLCVKYGRHCLYEKHSRTPLTRRHLTEVEERLERAEALIRKLRRSGSTTDSKTTGSVSTRPVRSGEEFDFCELERPFPVVDESSTTVAAIDASSTRVSVPSAASKDDSTPSDTRISRRESSSQRIRHSRASDQNPARSSNALLESAPRDDFEWDELDVVSEQSPWSDMLVEGEDEDQIKDGMASLAVSEREGGYLGVASGAAMLRLLEPNARPLTPRSAPQHRRLPSISAQPDPNRHIVDYMVDSYFSTYHPSYPIIHEPSFRAQYSEVITQPHGRSWQVLAYVVAAIGVYSSSAAASGDLDLQLFMHARSMLTFDFLEIGNITLVQALTLISNYQQKRNKPNSGYNYLGLAVRMATGLGLHKEFPGWNISPLKMEIRRRVWWSLCVFDTGATITFSRPMVWPYEGVEVEYPMNVTDRELTANSSTYPVESSEITPYTAVSTQAKFHVSTQEIYTLVISKPFPSAEELVRLDTELIEAWRANLPPYFNETSIVPSRYTLAHAIMQWRYRNFRIIMYRSFVIRAALQGRQGRSDDSPANKEAYNRCLNDAEMTINSISDYWARNEHNRLGGWYALYFLFQAALIPCICLRNAPGAESAQNWRLQLATTLRTIQSLRTTNSSAMRCYQVIIELCGHYLKDIDVSPLPPLPNPQPEGNTCMTQTVATGVDGNEQPPSILASEPGTRIDLGPTDESPQTQINQVFPMMWPNVNALEAADEVMGDDAWLEFLGSGVDDNLASWENS